MFANPEDQLIPGDEIDPNRPYPLNVTDAEGNTVPVVTTTGQYGYVGQLIVEFDEAGNLTTIDMGSGLVRVAGGNNPDAVAADPIVQDQVIEPVQAALEALENNVIATSEVPLNGERNAVRSQETNLGNLIADSLLWQANQLAADFGIEGSIDVALQNGGGIRNDTIIPAGNITELDTFDILPFSNFVSVFPEFSATQFKHILENSVSKITLENGEPVPSGEGTGRFAQIAGFNFSYEPTQTARETDEQGNVLTAGTRVQMVTLDDGTVIVENGKVVQNAPSISIATIDFLARGGDQYPFGDAPFTNLGVTYQQALSNYITDELNGVISTEDYSVGGERRTTIAQASPVSVPEPVSVLSLLTFGALTVLMRRK